MSSLSAKALSPKPDESKKKSPLSTESMTLQLKCVSPAVNESGSVCVCVWVHDEDDPSSCKCCYFINERLHSHAPSFHPALLTAPPLHFPLPSFLPLARCAAAVEGELLLTPLSFASPHPFCTLCPGEDWRGRRRHADTFHRVSEGPKGQDGHVWSDVLSGSKQ